MLTLDPTPFDFFSQITWRESIVLLRNHIDTIMIFV
jgi:hypothetical protein